MPNLVLPSEIMLMCAGGGLEALSVDHLNLEMACRLGRVIPEHQGMSDYAFANCAYIAQTPTCVKASWAVDTETFPIQHVAAFETDECLPQIEKRIGDFHHRLTNLCNSSSVQDIDLFHSIGEWDVSRKSRMSLNFEPAEHVAKMSIRTSASSGLPLCFVYSPAVTTSGDDCGDTGTSAAATGRPQRTIYAGLMGEDPAVIDLLSQPEFFASLLIDLATGENINNRLVIVTPKQLDEDEMSSMKQQVEEGIKLSICRVVNPSRHAWQGWTDGDLAACEVDLKSRLEIQDWQTFDISLGGQLLAANLRKVDRVATSADHLRGVDGDTSDMSEDRESNRNTTSRSMTFEEMRAKHDYAEYTINRIFDSIPYS